MSDETPPPLTDEEVRDTSARAYGIVTHYQHAGAPAYGSNAGAEWLLARYALQLERERDELKLWFDSANAMGVVVKPPEETDDQRAERLLGAWLVEHPGHYWLPNFPEGEGTHWVRLSKLNGPRWTGGGATKAAATFDALAKAGGKDG